MAKLGSHLTSQLWFDLRPRGTTGYPHCNTFDIVCQYLEIISPFAWEWYCQDMSTKVSIWERSELVDPLDEIIKKGDSKEGNYDLVMAQIPGLFGDSEKATYLGFRALGFRKGQVLELMGLGDMDYDKWVAETPELEDFEYHRIGQLQSHINADIIKLQFMRNMTLFLFQDSRIVGKSLTDFNELTNREYNYLRSIRRFYSNSDLLSLQKALEPEKHRNNTLVLSFGNAMFEVVEEDEGQTRLQEVINAADED